MNEITTIIFEDYKIMELDENLVFDEEHYNDDDLIEEEYSNILNQKDIYNDEHLWDTRVNRYRFKPEIWMLNIELSEDYN